MKFQEYLHIKKKSSIFSYRGIDTMNFRRVQRRMLDTDALNLRVFTVAVGENLLLNHQRNEKTL